MTSPLRILMAADVDPVHVIGGAERMLNNYSVRLAERGHSVTVLTRRENPELPPEETSRGVRVLRHAVDGTSGWSLYRSALSHGTRAAKRLLAEARFDLLNVHQPLAAATVLKTRASRSVPAVYTYLSPWSEEYLSREGGRLLQQRPWCAPWVALNAAVRRGLEREALNRVESVVVLSEFTRTQLRDVHGLPAARSTVIPGGVDTDRFHPVEDRAGLRRELGLPATGALLLTVRNLVERMGLDALLTAFAGLRRQIPDAMLCIGGTGVLRERLEAQARQEGSADAVRFLGFVPEEDLPRYYAAADLFVLPTRALEGFGLVTVEALACGTPVAGTPVGATAEVLGGFQPDFLFEDATAGAMERWLCGRVRGVLGDMELRRRCLEFARIRYSWSAVMDALEAHFRQVARGGCRVGVEPAK